MHYITLTFESDKVFIIIKVFTDLLTFVGFQ